MKITEDWSAGYDAGYEAAEEGATPVFVAVSSSGHVDLHTVRDNEWDAQQGLAAHLHMAWERLRLQGWTIKEARLTVK